MYHYKTRRSKNAPKIIDDIMRSFYNLSYGVFLADKQSLMESTDFLLYLAFPRLKVK